MGKSGESHDGAVVGSFLQGEVGATSTIHKETDFATSPSNTPVEEELEVKKETDVVTASNETIQPQQNKAEEVDVKKVNYEVMPDTLDSQSENKVDAGETTGIRESGDKTEDEDDLIIMTSKPEEGGAKPETGSANIQVGNKTAAS